MLHEYRDLINELRQSDNHFARLFNEHNELDEEWLPPQQLSPLLR